MKKWGLFVCFVLVLFFVSCTTEDSGTGDQQDEKVLVHHERLTPAPVTPFLLDTVLDLSGFFDDQILQNLTRLPVDVYRVVYWTTYKGSKIQVSGACVIPQSEEALPIVSYQHGTIFHDSEAPSEFGSLYTMSVEMGFNLVLASAEYICAVPDYPGYGISRDILHPYLHARSITDSCVDMLKAVNELCEELEVQTRNEYYLAGYSEGGFATMALQREIETNHAGLYPLVAVSAGAGVYDLLGTAREFMSQPVLHPPCYPAFLYVAYRDVYDWSRGLGEIFQSPYAERIEQGLFGGSYGYDAVNDNLSPNTGELFNPLFLSDFNGVGETILKEALGENSIIATAWVSQTPIRLYHGSDDRVVPPWNSQVLLNLLTSNGTPNIQYIPMPGEDHGSGTIPWAKGTVQWFDGFER